MNNFFKQFLAALLGSLVAFGLFFFLMIIILSALVASTSRELPVSVAQNSVLKIDLSKITIAERTTDALSGLNISSLFSDNIGPTLGIHDAIKAINNAANDNSIKMIYLTQNGIINIGLSNIEEIRNALIEFHASGKPIIAYGQNFSQGGYYLSSVADKIYMNPDGIAEIVGIGAQMLFFKDLIDKLGIDIQLIRHGKYKAAAEQFVNSNISKENRIQNEELYKSIWDTWANEICEFREITKDSLDYLVNNLSLNDAQSMLKYSLIDSIVTNNTMYNKICELIGADPDEGYKSVSLSNYAKLNPVNFQKYKIAIIYANGEITTDGSTGISSDKFAPMIKKIAKDKSIRAVVLRVNSPGGDAQAAELIREELIALKEIKPLIVSFGEYAASGGYWISAEADYIFSENTTITGSIGVFSIAPSIGKALKKNFGINIATIKTHNHSTMGTGIEPLDNTERELYQNFVEKIYSKFTQIVSNGRGMSVEAVDSIGQGRVWSGIQAYEKGLVDDIGGLADAIAYAKNSAYLNLAKQNEDTISTNRMYLDPSIELGIVEYPKIKTQMESFYDILYGNQEIRIENQLIDMIKSYKGVKTYARIPYIYQHKY